ncbi:hypothetical protein ABZ608_03520 [Streptomyces sp. NPDC013172]|uniref:hypothetical protein n=1 Tax=Streptomyces sp. NPDC013172 TaxID=3155009 RepID=UPI0033C2DF01
MRSSRTRLFAPAAALLRATACGAEHADQDHGAGAAVPALRAPVTDPPVDGARITSVTLPSRAAAARADDGDAAMGLRVVGL